MQSRVVHKTRLAMLAVAALALMAANSAHAADKIGVSMPNIKGPWFTPVLYGISDEAKKLGYQVTILDAGGYANVDKQVSQFSNLVVQKVSAILMDPANPASFNGVVREAKSEKIPVIGAGSPIVASDVEADAAASSAARWSSSSAMCAAIPTASASSPTSRWRHHRLSTGLCSPRAMQRARRHRRLRSCTRLRKLRVGAGRI